ncbi:aldolase [Candidatus Methylacidiphilum fumarolicum]|uniref:fructose-bisphosphate aldolase n=2 Tax=Candidatus Methylacidiphilum fumarolicum TaxID=591154 RepID=I0JYE2_METFB|nr:aldolase [Candidatus Methylacidiphilum fumarolicum]AEH40994.1 aldolase [Methylacidiphilum fumariolicum SolV]MBW6414803.1 aldolase [Candidatus Methylacidiphilum fumarolicum]TFE67358.1 aldolase [Candidatus Methylacidiphilum fumarolicum]TFE73336.1 aldolase [Candidatus Methylacidiphilum fumarolicum]TFE74117.1 aldolase [Candidatus Methylacidiphilum fumarolicum]
MIHLDEIKVPLDVPESKKDAYKRIFFEITQGSGRLMLMAGDQKVEHLNDDFYGPGISPEDADPEHLFKIASKARIGAFATQLGLIARYGMDYPNVRYIVKLNSKTHLVKTAQRDPLSLLWLSFEQLDYFLETKPVPIVGVGYTIYPGSEFEAQMLTEAARLVFEAHQRGLIAIIWSYPRGKAVSNETDPHLVAGAAGLGACLGADFVKVNPPSVKEGDANLALKEAVAAAGRTRLICAGGKETAVKDFLSRLHAQIHIGGTYGNATGRNIHQKSLSEAVAFCNAIAAITFDGASVEEAFAIYKES